MDRLDQFIQHMHEFLEERDWDQFHSPENLAKSISIEAGELLECFQWDGNYDLEDVSDEIADVMFYCLDLSERLGIDSIENLERKLQKNREKYPVEKSKGKNTKYNKL